MRFASWLARDRYTRGELQTEAAKRLGVSLASYMAWERGLFLPSSEHLLQIMSKFPMFSPLREKLRAAYVADKLRARRRRTERRKSAPPK